MQERDENGRFVKGASGNPRGRLPKDREEKYFEIMQTAVTFQDWKDITKKAVEQAKRGDAQARKWLSDYMLGAPVQRQEITGADGNPITVQVISGVKYADI